MCLHTYVSKYVANFLQNRTSSPECYQGRRNIKKNGGVKSFWAYSAHFDLNRVKISSKKLVGTSPHVPISSGGPELSY